jgi:hypothetical protein
MARPVSDALRPYADGTGSGHARKRLRAFSLDNVTPLDDPTTDNFASRSLLTSSFAIAQSVYAEPSPEQQVGGSSPARGTEHPSLQVRQLERPRARVVSLVPGVAQRSMTRIMPHGSTLQRVQHAEEPAAPTPAQPTKGRLVLMPGAAATLSPARACPAAPIPRECRSSCIPGVRRYVRP